MSNFNTYFSTLIITYLLEAYALRKMSVVGEDELILNITSMISVIGTKDNIAIPAQNKQFYAEMLNKNSGTMMIVLDELVNATYIIRNKDNNMVTYMVNFEHDYIKKFIDSHGIALKYVSHPSYSLKRNYSQICNEENSLCEAIKNMNISIEYKKKKEENESNIAEENTNLVENVDKEEVYYVKSERNPKVKYMVTSTSCTCPSFTYGKGEACKHMINIDSLKTNLKSEKGINKENTSLFMKAIYSVQSDTDFDKFHNIYIDINEKYYCSCLSYKYQCAKTNAFCKHIDGFLREHYQKYPEFTLVNHFEKMDNKPIFVKNNEIYNKYFSRKMFDDKVDNIYFIDETKYYGLYVWAFDDSLTDGKLEKEAVMKENKLYQQQNNEASNEDDSVGPNGTYDGLTDDD